MPNEDNKILKYNHGEKSMKASFMIHADLIHVKIILKNLTQKKKTMHTSSGYSMFQHCSFDPTKSKLDCYRGKDCMEKFCKDLRQHATRIINYEKKKEKRNNTREQKIKQKSVTYAKTNLVLMMTTIKSIIKSQIISITQENLEELLMVFIT